MKNIILKREFSKELSQLYKLIYEQYEYDYYLYKSINKAMVEPLLHIPEINKFVIICDENVEKLYALKVSELIGKERCIIISFKGGEENKSLAVINNIIEEILSYKVTRRTCIIGLGGGITGNMAGMVAAMLFRGLKLVHIPTSLMAILDSVISLKQAINSSYGKNLIGFFYKPEMVITSMEFLKTLPKEHIISGICEVIKNALTIVPSSIEVLKVMLNSECNYTDENYFYFTDMSIKAKQKMMQNDHKERKEALIFEYGHTIGHAIELYSKGDVNHGQGVGLGMICAAEISRAMGYLSPTDVTQHLDLLRCAGSMVKLPKYMNVSDILSIMRFDNKRGYLKQGLKEQHMVLLKSIGEPLLLNNLYLVGVKEELLLQVMQDMLLIKEGFDARCDFN